jgi:hypothetical protein
LEEAVGCGFELIVVGKVLDLACYGRVNRRRKGVCGGRRGGGGGCGGVVIQGSGTGVIMCEGAVVGVVVGMGVEGGYGTGREKEKAAAEASAVGGAAGFLEGAEEEGLVEGEELEKWFGRGFIGWMGAEEGRGGGGGGAVDDL